MKGTWQTTNKRLLVRIGAILLFFFGGLVFTFYRLELSHINNESRLRITAFHNNFRQEVRRESELLGGLLTFIAEDKALQRDWAARDRAALLRDATPLFERLRARYHITHFYFITPDKRCFLRVHKPEKSGDLIDRITLDIASHIRKPSQGLELGPLGTFTLRVVTPWFVNGQLVGFLEIGEEVDHITSHVSGIVNVDLLCMVDKRYLDRQQWESGMRMLGRPAEWSRFRNYVLVSSTSNRRYANLDRYLSGNWHNGSIFTVTSQDRQFIGGYDALIDAAGNNVGRFLIFYDNTAVRKNLHILVLSLSVISLLVAAIILVLVARYTKGLCEPLGEDRQPALPQSEERQESVSTKLLAERN